MFEEKKFLAFTEFENSKSLEEKERLCDFAKEIIAITQKSENYIDEGGAAKIYKLNDRGVCIKMIKYKPLVEQSTPYGRRRSPEDEARYLDQLSTFSVDDVRSPHFIQGVFHSKKSVIIMEQLPAINLQHAINDPSLFPHEFDHEAFFEQVEDYVTGLHEDQGLIHGDLFARNIMVDEETCNPYIIDFGRTEEVAMLTTDRSKELKRKELLILEKNKKDALRALTNSNDRVRL